MVMSSFSTRDGSYSQHHKCKLLSIDLACKKISIYIGGTPDRSTMVLWYVCTNSTVSAVINNSQPVPISTSLEHLSLALTPNINLVALTKTSLSPLSLEILSISSCSFPPIHQHATERLPCSTLFYPTFSPNDPIHTQSHIEPLYISLHFLSQHYHGSLRLGPAH